MLICKCLQADFVSLYCLATLCDRAAASLCRSGALQGLPSLFSTATAAVSQERSVEALIAAISNAAIATENQGLVVQLDDLVVDPASPATQLGKTLLPLLEKMPQMTNCESLMRCLQQLANAAGASPSLLAGDLQVFQTLVQTCLQISGEARLAALEVLSSLCAVRDVQRKILNANAGSAIRSTLLNGVIAMCAQLCVDGVDEDVEEWALEAATLLEDVASSEGDDVAVYAESLLCTFLHNLGGGQQSLPVVLPLVETLLNGADWKHHRAALSVLEQCLYAAPVTFLQHIPVALEAALKLSACDNVRVQYQALTLLGALCQEGNVSLRQQHGGRILEAVSRLVASHCSKVSAIASVVIVSYCRGGRDKEEDVSTLVVPFVREVLLALVTGPLSVKVVNGSNVNSGALAAQVKAIGAVACLAEACAEEFVPFYGDVVPGLLGFVQTSSTNQEVSQLRGAAIEAMTIVGQGIGEDHRDVFVPDAEKVMQIALPVLQAASESPVIPMDQLLSACARIASVMGEQYTPFVEQVLPHLLNRLNEKVDIFYEEGTEAGLEASKRGDVETDDDGNETITISLPGKGLTKVSINMAKIEEKAQACRAIYEHAAALGASFGPFAETILAALTPLISFTYSAEVRSTASQAAAAVFDTACQAGIPVAQEYLPLLSSTMCKQIYTEGTTDMEVLYALCEALSDTLYFAYRTLTSEDRSIIATFTVGHGNEIVQLLMSLISSCLGRRSNIFQTLAGVHGNLSGGDEYHELTQTLQSEQEILTPLVDSVGYTLKFLKEQFLPIFDTHVSPVLGRFLERSLDTRARFAATALFDDCVEHCGPAAAHKYGALLADGVMLGISDNASGDDDEVMQVSLYGIVQIARQCPPNILEPHAQALMQQLMSLANASKDEADNVFIIEYAASALASLTLIGKAPLGHLQFLNKKDILSTFLRQVPLREDEDEAKVCHAGFCDLIAAGQIDPATETACVLRIIGETLAYIDDGEDLASPETQSKFAEILLKMQRDVAADSMQQAYQSLAAEARVSVDAMMQQYA